MSKKKKRSRRRRKSSKKARKVIRRRRRRSPKKAARKVSRRRRRRSPKKAARKVSRRRRSKSRAKKMGRRSMRSARAMGMVKGVRKNPGGILGFLKAEAQDMMAIAPSVAVQLGTMAAVGFASSKVSEQIRKRVAPAGAVHKFAGAISSGAITIAAFAAMKMMKSPKTKQFTLPVLFGGMAATLVQVLAAVKVKKDTTEVSLGQHLGLPIGEYMALNGFIDVNGRPLAVDGYHHMGDYIPQALGRVQLSQGPYHEGTIVTPMGEYVAQGLGEIGQMSEGRQGARALGSEGDMTIESFVESSSLSGSIFDD